MFYVNTHTHKKTRLICACNQIKKGNQKTEIY
uniref:Uncharacterized protein n=1 Tax=Rhizophora mucronata TaxID=61149 RepID=A0A2P2NLB8_RHIMU